MCSELTAGLGGSYLLVPGSPHVSGIGIRPGAGHSTEAAVQALGPSRTSTGLCTCPLSCLLLPVLLSFQVIPIGLEQSEVAWVGNHTVIICRLQSWLVGAQRETGPLAPPTLVPKRSILEESGRITVSLP